jgi:hypothetical protein
MKDKCVAYINSNCFAAGAVFRGAYVHELMKHIKVHSYGKCFHNTDLPPEMQAPVFKSFGESMKFKRTIFQDFKFVLSFENNNVTDYVTEKMPVVLLGGAVPVYMGAPNVHPEWTPGEVFNVEV